MQRTSVATPHATVGLRERKRAAAMHHIQSVAIGLFDRHGFTGVTIEDIAAAAEVSASSIYRYFGTKEGLVIHDEHDEPVMRSLLGHLRYHDIHDAAALALADIAPEHFERDAELTERRLRYVFSVPSVRAAVLLKIDETVRVVAGALAIPDRMPRRDAFEAQVVASSVVWALFAALEHAHAGASGEPVDATFNRALDAIRPDGINQARSRL